MIADRRPRLSNANLYETVLEAAAGALLTTPRPPRPSASVVLWRRVTSGLEVFWIKRSEDLAFMGGWHAFPGGALDKKDQDATIRNVPSGWDFPVTPESMPETLSEGLGPPTPNLAPGIVACALRELAEETGLRVEDASRLVFAGRWLTPPLGPVRFDNRFFLLEWPPGEALQPQAAPQEAEYGEWISPAEGFARWVRGEALAAPPILHLLKVLAEVGPTAGLERLRAPAEANLGPYRRIEFRPGVLLLPLPTATLPPAAHTNAFLLGGRELVLIDPGATDPTVLDRVEEAVRAAELQGGRTRAIWLTHHHPDHVGGASELSRRLTIPIAAHRDTADRLGLGVGRLPPIRVDEFLEDGQRVVLGTPGLAIRVVHTPGHTRGHLCFLDEAGGSLIAGDMLSAISTIVIDPPEGDMDQYLESIRKLSSLPVSTLFPAHGPPIRNGRAALEKLLAHRLKREEKVLAGWRQGLRRPADLRPVVYEEELPAMIFPLAERQIVAHLERLQRAGRLDP